MSKLNVLIISGWVDQAFTFVRSLGQQSHIRMYVADCWPNSPIGFSRHCKGFHLIPPPGQPEHVSEILSFCREFEIDIVLPVQHDETLEVAKHKRQFEDAGIRVPIPDYPLVELAMDKHRMARLARERGIAVPVTYLLSEIELHNVDAAIGFPLLTKLRSSTGQLGQKKVNNMDELLAQLQSLSQTHQQNEILLQEFIPGTVRYGMYTVGLIYDHRHQLAACVPLKKIRSKPYTGGTAICTKAEDRSDVRQAAIELMAALGPWTGIADIELKIDPRDGKAKFIELNPRPWGSIYGAYAAGVDFPMLWVRVAQQEDIQPVETFQENIYVSFLARDLLLLTEIVEKLFTRERRLVWDVLKTYTRPYLRRNEGSQVPITSDFVLSDLRPFWLNISRVRKKLVPRIRAR